jgi:hypothetical protein
LLSASLLSSINPTLAAIALEQAQALGPLTIRPSHDKPQPHLGSQFASASATGPQSNDRNNHEAAALPIKASLLVDDIKNSFKQTQNGVSLKPGESSAPPASPRSPGLTTLCSWNIEQLGTLQCSFTGIVLNHVLIRFSSFSESYVHKLEASNHPAPNTVRIVLDDLRNKEKKKYAKRLANRKSARISRSRKNRLVDELTASHAILRRQVLILPYLPDPDAVIGTDVEIKFCSAQMRRV